LQAKKKAGGEKARRIEVNEYLGDGSIVGIEMKIIKKGRRRNHDERRPHNLANRRKYSSRLQKGAGRRSLKPTDFWKQEKKKG